MAAPSGSLQNHPVTTHTDSLHQRAAAMEATEDIIYGSLAGIVGKFVEYPFDTVKVRLQSQPDSQPLRYKGPLDCFRQSIKTDGVVGLYRGISAPLLGASLETSSLFFFERVSREAVQSLGFSPRGSELPLPALWLTGAFSGVFTSFILTPIELVKCKIQVPATVNGRAAQSLRPLGVIRDVYKYHGVMGFWHGQLPTLIREAGGSAAWFGTKETVTKMFRNLNAAAAKTETERIKVVSEPLPLWQQAVAGASAGMSYNFLFFPADTIKSRMQTTAVASSVKGQTFWSEATTLWKQHGLRGLYRGCGITVLRSGPSSAFIFMVYDGLKHYLPLQ